MRSSSSSSSKQGSENNRGISGHMFTLHQRLYHALNLGFRCYNDKARKWYCADIEIHRLMIRSIDAFLDCISSETSQHPLVKDSIPDMFGALRGVLQFKSVSVLSLASNVAVKMIKILPNSIIQYHALDLVRPLSYLLSSRQLQVAASCAAALSLIFSNLSSRKEAEVWEVLKETNLVADIIRNIHDFSGEILPNEYFQEMASLLSKTLWRWPPSRFYVCSDAKLMEVLYSISLKPELSMKFAVLQLYSSLALCSNGAKKLLKDGETALKLMMQCMDSSNPHSLQMEAYKLAQCLAISEHGCLKMMKMCGEPLIKCIISGMRCRSLHSGKLAKDHMYLLVEACHMALITRWAGEHHSYFWKLGIDSVLLDLIVNNFGKTHQSLHFLSLKEQITIAKAGLDADFLLVLRPYIWDILGGLAAHCAEDHKPKTQQNELHTNILITCACLAFVDSIRIARLCQSDFANTSGSEPASRAVLMIIYSPCKYFASQARSALCEILRSSGKENLKYLLDSLQTLSSGSKFGNLQIVIYLVSLACYSGLPQYRKHVMDRQGIKTLWTFIKWWLSNPVRIKRLTVAPHLHNRLSEKNCCYDFAGDWEGEDMFLLLGLWGLAELIHHSGFVKSSTDLSTCHIDYSEAELIPELQKICSGTYAPGPRWYAAYILCYFGIYGFPCKLGNRIEKAFYEKEHTDLKLVLTNKECLNVHGVILMVRCPSLLPSRELSFVEKTSGNSSVEKHGRETTEVRLSAHVDHSALLKILEFVYSGYLQAEEDIVKKLRIFSRHCQLHALLQMLYRKSPKWGMPIPRFDLTIALGLAGHHFSDIVVEAKSTDVDYWKCNVCSLTVPHMHVHKVVLCSSCDYLRALFQSGMQESQSQTVKVPVGWDALVKLINWLYSDELPKPTFGCLWKNLDAEEKLHEVQPYVELCWLAEYWLLGDLHEECSRIVISCLASARELSINLIQLAANFSQWRLAEAAAEFVAPLYHRLRSSGELEALDEELIEMIRTASVRFTQEGSHHSS